MHRLLLLSSSPLGGAPCAKGSDDEGRQAAGNPHKVGETANNSLLHAITMMLSFWVHLVFESALPARANSLEDTPGADTAARSLCYPGLLHAVLVLSL